MIGRITLFAVLLIAMVSMFLLVSKVTYFPESDVWQPFHTQFPEIGSLTTDTWGLFDPITGVVVAGSNTSTIRPIASITKLFTAYAVMESEKSEFKTTIEWSDIKTEGRAGKLINGEITTPSELLFPLLIESSNDAGEAIRRTLGFDFVTALNGVQKTLLLVDTSINDSTGLNDRNMSTVTELARFYSYLRAVYPHVIDITKLNTYLNNRIGLVNNNPARTRKDFTGGKHGYTKSAGRTFVGTFELTKEGEEVGIVLLGSSDLLSDINTLIDYAQESRKQ